MKQSKIKWRCCRLKAAEIIQYNADVNAIVIRINDLPSSLTGTGEIFDAANQDGVLNDNVAGLLCEIYSPITTTENSFYYEMFSEHIYYNLYNFLWKNVLNFKARFLYFFLESKDN